MVDQINFNIVLDLFKNKSVALVGPADNLIGQEAGHSIDSCDIVCRINSSYIIPKNLKIDYGSRTDVVFNGCNCLLLCVLKRHINMLQDTTLIINPSSRVHNSDNHLTGRSAYENYMDYDIGLPFYQSEGKYEQAMKKRGMNTGLCSVNFLSNPTLKIKKLKIFGFSFYNSSNERDRAHTMNPYHHYLFDIDEYICNCPKTRPCQRRSDRVSANNHTNVTVQEKQRMMFKELTNGKNFDIHQSILNSL
jgi:hypothetical protein